MTQEAKSEVVNDVGELALKLAATLSPEITKAITENDYARKNPSRALTAAAGSLVMIFTNLCLTHGLRPEVIFPALLQSYASGELLNGVDNTAAQAELAQLEKVFTHVVH